LKALQQSAIAWLEGVKRAIFYGRFVLGSDCGFIANLEMCPNVFFNGLERFLINDFFCTLQILDQGLFEEFKNLAIVFASSRYFHLCISRPRRRFGFICFY
jgi:hypothetical protein